MDTAIDLSCKRSSPSPTANIPNIDNRIYHVRHGRPRIPTAGWEHLDASQRSKKRKKQAMEELKEELKELETCFETACHMSLDELYVGIIDPVSRLEEPRPKRRKPTKDKKLIQERIRETKRLSAIRCRINLKIKERNIAEKIKRIKEKLNW